MAPVGEAASTWAQGLELLSGKKAEEALKLGTELQAKGKASGVKMNEAAGAVLTAVAQMAKGGLDVAALGGATWSETAVLLSAPSGSGPAVWQKALEAAKAAAGKGAPALKTAPRGGDRPHMIRLIRYKEGHIDVESLRCGNSHCNNMITCHLLTMSMVS